MVSPEMVSMDDAARGEREEEEVKVDAMLARMDELMAMVSIATSDDDFREKRQHIAKKLRRTSIQLMRTAFGGKGKEDDMSGSEEWEGASAISHDSQPAPATIKELFQRSREADEVAKLAKLISLQSIQLEVSGQRTQAAEQRCEALEERARAAEDCIEALEAELTLRRRRAEVLELHRRQLEAENVELQRRLQNLHPEKENKEEGSAESLHEQATRLLEKLSQPRSSHSVAAGFMLEGSVSQAHEGAGRAQGSCAASARPRGTSATATLDSKRCENPGDVKVRWADWHVQPGVQLHFERALKAAPMKEIPKGHASAPTPRFAVTGVPVSRRTLPARVETARSPWQAMTWNTALVPGRRGK
ncbi:GIP [Symbiodinium sp. CCMP2592]|nr:GIP [Symbiodinium sp. CCMP2592]